jgi:hypothetical protein
MSKSSHHRSGARIVENGFATSNSVNKICQSVLAKILQNPLQNGEEWSKNML